jgi:hypothetical protein
MGFADAGAALNSEAGPTMTAQAVDHFPGAKSAHGMVSSFRAADLREATPIR